LRRRRIARSDVSFSNSIAGGVSNFFIFIGVIPKFKKFSNPGLRINPENLDPTLLAIHLRHDEVQKHETNVSLVSWILTN